MALVLAAGLPAAAQQSDDQKAAASKGASSLKAAEAAKQKQELERKIQGATGLPPGRLKAQPETGGANGNFQGGPTAIRGGQPPTPPGAAPITQPGAQPGAQPGTQPGAGPQRGPAGATGVAGATGTGSGAHPSHITRGGGEPEDGPVPGPDEVVLSQFSDGVDLKALIEYVAETLHINIIGNDTLTGSVVLNGPMVIKKANLIPLLNSMLENQNFTITSDFAGFYKVIPIPNTTWNPTGDLPTTRVIPTPTIKPSTLADAINNQLGIAGAQTRLSYMDDLGVIIVTDSSRRIEALSELVQRVINRSQGQRFIRFDLKHVAAPIARQRVLDLLGVGSQAASPFTPPPNPAQAGQQAQLVSGVVTNLSDRLSIDPAGNALIFRGYPEESQRIEEALGVIDRPNMLHYDQYYAGRAAEQIAGLAERLGLGHVETVETEPESSTTTAGFTQPQNRFQLQRANAALQQQQEQTLATAGGPVMIVDVSRNLIIYYGTDSQHKQLKDLIDKFDTAQDEVLIANYKIKNQQAQDVADVLSGVVYGQSGPDTSSPFFGGGFGGGFNNLRNQFGNQNNSTTNNRNNRNNRNTNTRTSTTGTRTNQPQGGSNIRPFGFGGGFGQNRGGGQAGTGPGSFNPDEVFIMADTANNQVIIKAPKGQQEEFARLIAKLDQRRPQVQIEVQIVSVTATDDFRFAVESQLRAGQFLLNTNFGLGSLTQSNTSTGTGGATSTTTTGGFTSPKMVRTDLPGLTSALIRSNYVPFVINAMKENTDTRILSSPQITVDDNVQATIESQDEQPTSTTSQTNSSTINSFGGYEQAGTIVTVTPSISEGGYMRLQYDIELSNFVGTGSNGFPPPKQVRHVTSDSVTIPGDTTIVVGGIKVDTKSSTINKIPWLGDIPIIGNLFKDTNKNSTTTRLYVFITPRILRDANFRDLRLLTQGPLKESGLAADLPPLEPAMMDMSEPEPRILPASRTRPEAASLPVEGTTN